MKSSNTNVGERLRGHSAFIGIRGFIFKDNVAAIICVMPFILGFLLFLVAPMLISLYYSFTSFNLTRPPRWVGLDNYINMLSDPEFWNTMRVTFHYTFVAVPLRLIFALAVAMMLLKGGKLTGVLRAAYYLPSMIGGSVAAAILWRMTFRADGPLNSIIQIFFPEFSHAWAGDTRTAIYVLILLAVWQFGSAMLIFLASLKQVPDYLYEASDIDGAGRVRKFFKITLPLLTPTIFFNLVMQTISGLLVFAQVFIIFTQRGEPMGSTRVVALQMYRMAFEFQRAGDASAMAWFTLLVISLITGILFVTKRFWVYEGGL